MGILWIYNGFIRNMNQFEDPSLYIRIIWFHQLSFILHFYVVRTHESAPKKTLHDSTTGSLVALLLALDASGISQLSLPAVLGGLVTPRCCPLSFRGKILTTWMFFWEGIWSLNKKHQTVSQVYPKVVLLDKTPLCKTCFVSIWISIRSFWWNDRTEFLRR